MTLEEYIKTNKYHDVKIISSYHNHNALCRHASGNVKDYVLKAKEKGLKIIGISDHGPLDEIVETRPRMSKEEFLNDYLKQFEEVKKLGIIVKKGVELEYFKELHDHYCFCKQHLDYMILGQHIFRVNGKMRSVHKDTLNDEDYLAYENAIYEALDTNLFSFLAHPDIIFFNNENISSVGKQVLERIVIYCVKKDIPLEVNVNGLRRQGIGSSPYRYTRQEYLDLLKKYNAKVIVSDDAHAVSQIIDEKTKITYSYLEDEGYNIVYKLEV